MMNELHLWHGLSNISVSNLTEDSLTNIAKVCCVSDHIFVCTEDRAVFHGIIDKNGGKNLVIFKKTDILALDISCNKQYLYYVNSFGQVFRSCKDFESYEEIILKEDARCCSHGYKTPGHIVKVKNVAAGDNGCLFVTETGQLWASGHHPQIGIEGDEPKKVTFFEKRIAISVSCGSDFNLALVYKPTACNEDKPETDSDTDDVESEVFVSTCPQCLIENISSPTSLQSHSENCPLGLPIHHTNEDKYSSSTQSKDNTVDDKKSTDDSTSLSLEEKYNLTEQSVNLPDKIVVTVTGEKECNKIEVDDVSDDTNNSENVKEKEEIQEGRRNEFFINTDAARQFLTRQLSWVSSYGGAGEELLVEASLVRPTRLLKQNVSHMASFVYEGVKTGVVTLSRHVSGGSETSETLPAGIAQSESFEDISNENFKTAALSITSSLKCEDFPWSSSTGTSDHGSDCGIMDRVCTMAKAGNALLNTELWSWGNVEYGQLGIGDMGKRSRPTIVSRLAGLGVCKIVCGKLHALAVTLDGRAFAWGKNSVHQVSTDTFADQSSPQVIPGVTERVKDIAAGDNHSLILTHDGNLYFLGKDGTEAVKKTVKIDIPILDNNKIYKKTIFSSKQLGGCVVLPEEISSCIQDLALEQSFLEEILLVFSTIIKPIQKKGTVTQETNVYEVLCSCYNEIVSFTALNVWSLREFTDRGGDANSISFIHSVDEFVRTYKNYLNAACDVIALSGFAHISRLLDVPQKLFTLFSERLQLKKSKKSSEAIITCALLHPLNRMCVYKCMIQSLIKNNSNKNQLKETRESVQQKLNDALSKWEQLWEEQEHRKRDADITRQFWESAGKVVELLRSPERRLIRDSRSHPVSVLNSSRFSSHWFILLTDVLIHVTGGSSFSHSLQTIWVEPLQDTDVIQNGFTLTMPEDAITLVCPSPQDKHEWVQSIQNAVKRSLHKSQSHTPPAVRTASYTFTKHPHFRDAKYTGRWLVAKLQGSGKLEWPNGQVYIGQFHNNQFQGYGRMEIPGTSTYDGQWKDGQQDGYGTVRYDNGDLYEGNFKDGQAHGHGVYKRGHFMSSTASMYIGEWVNGVKQGYGVMDDIFTGEKYLGCWSNNMKHGCGLIVTLDGIYYEGIFMQDVLTGHGVMVFEDGTHYEGEFRAAGIFNGKGNLTFQSGDYVEGSMHGAWNEGIKVTGTLFKNSSAPREHLSEKPSSFGKLCVNASQKWKAIFRNCYQQLGITEPTMKNKLNIDVQKVWENIAIAINTSHQETLQRVKRSNLKNCYSLDNLDFIPEFGRDSLDKESFHELHNYLLKAFETPHHPLGELLFELTEAYTATYGGVRVHPLLLSHAVAELHSITSRIYEVVRIIFPALPPLGQEMMIAEAEGDQESEVVNVTSLLHPILLPRVHSALFVLYALHNKKEDDAYWKRLLKWNKQPDITLLSFLGIDQKFWIGYSTRNHSSYESSFSSARDMLFSDAVENLQQLKTTFSPLEKLQVIRNTFQQMTKVVQQELGTTYLWTMDDLFPVFHFIVVRARILQLGSEIHFIEDFMEPHLEKGELGIMFTTLKACYYQILQEKMTS